MNNVVLNVDIDVDVFEECLTLIMFIMSIVNINVLSKYIIVYVVTYDMS